MHLTFFSLFSYKGRRITGATCVASYGTSCSALVVDTLKPHVIPPYIGMAVHSHRIEPDVPTRCGSDNRSSTCSIYVIPIPSLHFSLPPLSPQRHPWLYARHSPPHTAPCRLSSVYLRGTPQDVSLCGYPYQCVCIIVCGSVFRLCMCVPVPTRAWSSSLSVTVHGGVCWHI